MQIRNDFRSWLPRERQTVWFTEDQIRNGLPQEQLSSLVILLAAEERCAGHLQAHRRTSFVLSLPLYEAYGSWQYLLMQVVY